MVIGHPHRSRQRMLRTVRGTVRFPDGAPASDVVVSIDDAVCDSAWYVEMVGLHIGPP